MTEQNTIQKISYRSEEYNNVISATSDRGTNDQKMILFLGPYLPHKNKALNDIKKNSALNIELVETSEYVSSSFHETKKNLDDLFLDADGNQLFYFLNGDKLCGVYTGFTQSKVKYATPQERYFFEKIKQFQGVVIIDIANVDAADESLLRKSDVNISFPMPKSLFSRFLFGLKNYSFHGYNFRTKRPEKYTEQT